MADCALKHVSDGFDAAMRMGGEAFDWTFERIVECEMVEEQKGVKFVAGVRTERTAKQHARAFDYEVWFDYVGNGSVCHVVLMICIYDLLQRINEILL
jgi:hypothetical protein